MGLMDCAAFLMALFLQDAGVKEPDYSSVDRKVGKQPEYAGKPLYGLFLLDPEGKHPIWVVLDKSKPLSSLYDVAYVDLNGNRDLEDGERFLAAGADIHANWVVIRIGDIKVPGTDLKHSGFSIQTTLREERVCPGFELKWADKEPISGGHGQETMDGPWAEKPSEAPVFHPYPYGVLRFCLWDICDENKVFRKSEFVIGRRHRVRLLVGNPGWGKTSFSAVSETFLDLRRDELRFTLIYTDKSGIERRETVQVKEHC